MLLYTQLPGYGLCRLDGVVPVAGYALVYGERHQFHLPFGEDAVQAEEKSGAVLAPAHGNGYLLILRYHASGKNGLFHLRLKIGDEMILAEVIAIAL